MSSAKAQAQSSAKRMQLSRDQKALLETVYAMEKLRRRVGATGRWAPPPTRTPRPSRRRQIRVGRERQPVTDANAAIVALLVVIFATAPPVIAL